MKRNLILTPGPTKVPEELCEVLGRPIIHHRTPQFQEYLKETTAGLKRVLQTQGDVYLLACSGTGAMEAAVCNLLSPGDEAITVQGGKFGERWGELCKAFGATPHILDIEWGYAVTADQIKQALTDHPNTKAVFITLCETSTATTPDIKAIGEVVKETDAVLVVDAVSGLGAQELRQDEWNVDMVCSGSHKGFMLPPGLGIISASPKAQEVFANTTNARFYFDLRKSKKVVDANDTPFTPAISLVIALNESIKMIEEKGLDNLLAHHARLAKAVRAAAVGLGLKVFTDETAYSTALTAISLPEDIDGGKLAKEMRDVEGITVAGGQGHLKGKIIRIAHMGCVDEYDILTGVSCLEKVLYKMGHKFELGAGLSAAQDALHN